MMERTHPRAQQLRCFRDGKQKQSRTRHCSKVPTPRHATSEQGTRQQGNAPCRAFNIGGIEFTQRV